MSDLVFAIFHLLLLLGVLGYAFIALFHGNYLRFLLIIAGLAAYYFLVLHKPVRKEIERKRKLKQGDRS